jgi:Tol biopolymer transport system component
MVTGHKAFQGDSRISTLSAILKEDPKPPENIPADLDKILRRCLRKDRDKRYQHMDDLKLALEEVREDSESGKTGVASAAIARSSKLPWIAGAGVISALLAAGGWYLRPKAAENGPAELTRVTFNAGLTTSPALSPDGKLLAYASDRATNGENLDIWLQHMAGGEPMRLTKDDANESEPSFSPDGSQLAYTSSRGGIFLIPVLGGEPRQLSPRGLRPRFSPDGKWIAYYEATIGAGEGSQLWIVPVAGGSPRRLSSEFGRPAFPVWSPDGASLLIDGGGRNRRRDWWLVPVDGGDPRPMGLRSLMREAKIEFLSAEPAFWAGDWVVFTARFSNRSQVMRVRLDLAAGKVTGKIEPVTSGTAQDQDATGAADGKIAFASLQFSSDLWILPVDTNQGKVTGPMQRLTEDAALNDYASISEDGAKVAFLSNRDGKRAMWQRDMASGKLRKVSSPSGRLPEGATFPGMTRDGRKASFEVIAEDGKSRYVVADLIDGSLQEYPGSGWGISPSGRFLLLLGKSRADPIEATRADTSERHDFMAQSKWPQRSPRFSPDERWVALHVVNTEATRQVWIMPFHFGRPTPESEWIAITDGKTLDRDADWSPDGNLLYWLADRNGVRGFWAVKLDPATKRPLAPAFEVMMFPGTRRSMMKFGNTSAVHSAIARDKIVFALGEEAGSIWTTRLPQANK